MDAKKLSDNFGASNQLKNRSDVQKSDAEFETEYRTHERTNQEAQKCISSRTSNKFSIGSLSPIVKFDNKTHLSHGILNDCGSSSFRASTTSNVNKVPENSQSNLKNRRNKEKITETITSSAINYYEVKSNKSIRKPEAIESSGDKAIIQEEDSLLLRRTNKFTDFTEYSSNTILNKQSGSLAESSESANSSSHSQFSTVVQSFWNNNKTLNIFNKEIFSSIANEFRETENKGPASVNSLKSSKKKRKKILKSKYSRTSFFNNTPKIVNFSFKKSSRKASKKENADDNKNKNSKKIQKKIFKEDKEDLEIKAYFRDLFFYILFLILLTLVSLGMVSSNMYFFKDVTAQIFFDTLYIVQNNTNNNSSENEPRKTLRECITFADFWSFAETTLIYLFYWNFYFSQIDPVEFKADSDRKMFFENQILGVPRIRQVRVTNMSCGIHPNMRRFFDSCYGAYSVFTEDTRPIMMGMENSLTATAWVYTEASVLNTSYYRGELGTYGGGGYYIDLARHKDDSLKILNELKTNEWISRETRALFINFNLYNANVNLFCLCMIVLEFPPVGGILPFANFYALKLLRYLNAWDFFIMGCEFVLFIFAIFYTIELIRTIIREKITFLFHFWNYVDFIIIFLSYVYVIISIILYFRVKELIKILDDRPYKYTEFEKVKSMQILYNNIIAFHLFASWIKLFKFLNYNSVMMEFNITLSRSFRDILKFSPMFLSLFFAFALLGHLLFGNQVKDYDTLWASMLALLQTFVGTFEYRKIQQSNVILGPAFYVAYIFFIIFVTMNIFIAIINDVYGRVKSQVLGQTPKTGKYFKRALLNILKNLCCGLDKKIMKKGMENKQLVLYEIRKLLKSAGFTDLEINIFFSKYDFKINNTKKITKKQILESLELKKVNFNETEQEFETDMLKRRIDELQDKFEELEISLRPAIDKLDVLINQSIFRRK